MRIHYTATIPYTPNLWHGLRGAMGWAVNGFRERIERILSLSALVKHDGYSPLNPPSHLRTFGNLGNSYEA